MSTYDRNTDIQEIPLRTPYFRDKVKRFLEANGLRMEALDSYYAVTDDSGEILAGAGIAGSVLKCLAVSETLRSSGMLVPLVSRIMSEHPGPLKVFTKPEYQTVFESMGFRLLASAPLAILLENGRGLEQYCEYLRAQARPGRCGVVVMNANPFTLGHQYLLQEAAKQVDHLFVIPVKEDLSDFPYAERKAMIMAGSVMPDHEIPGQAGNDVMPDHEIPGQAGNDVMPDHDRASAGPTRISVLEGSDYVISAATFPTYFLKDLSQAAETHMRLDLDLYGRWIAPALGATIRFVGSEPLDALTNRYNQLITQSVVVPRLELDGIPVSASRVRNALSLGRLTEASALCPVSSRPYLLAALAQRALFVELDTPMKPGLVCPDSPGAHSDMDYTVMAAGIRALRPFWSQMALAPDAPSLIALGIEAEKAMMAATGGVNTHRGAIFCLGIALNAAMRCFPDNGRFSQSANNQQDMQIALCDIAGSILCNQLNVNDLTKTPLTGARAIAATGYRQLFEDWLPYYRDTLGLRPRYDNVIPSEASELRPRYDNVIPSEASESHLKLLLRIMSTLDDTCVVHRVGKERAEIVKKEAEALLKEMPDQVGHDEKVAGHDEKVAGHDEKVAGHDEKVVGHDEKVVGHDGKVVGHDEKVAGHDGKVVGHDAPVGHDGTVTTVTPDGSTVTPDLIGGLCKRYAAEGISPGGAADMLALTIFIHSILS